MLKRLIVGTLICLLGGAYAQTDARNAGKYWKFRNNFRRDFIKIGSERGESIPIATRLPIGCTNNVDGTGAKGTLRWGDGMIFHGHYIGFLATEYRLLKNREENTRAVLNELYYALEAINRVDLKAEPIITEITENEHPVVMGDNLDGYYLRDDAGQDMYKNWENAPIKCRCTQGSSYFQNNVAGSNVGNYTARSKTDHWSEPSLDQLTSLLVGLTVIDKLVEDAVYVQPTLDDPVMDIRNEAHKIVNRLVSHAKDHNWFLLNSRGWPVQNGGGELLLTAYPMAVINNNITGNDYRLSPITRRAGAYRAAAVYYSEVPSKRYQVWDTLNFFEKFQVETFTGLDTWYSGGLSNFENVHLSGAYNTSPIFFSGVWGEFTPELHTAISEDLLDDDFIDDALVYFDVDEDNPILPFYYPSSHIKDYNASIITNLGVASKLFSSEMVASWTNLTSNYQLELIDALLKDGVPTELDRDFTKQLLDSMAVYGGFKFTGQSWDSDPVIAAHLPKQVVWSAGWGGEYKWNDPVESNSKYGHEGQFNALDYMYLHNLYYLVFGAEIEEEYEETYDCFCGEIEMGDIYSLQADSDDDIVAEDKTLVEFVNEEVVLHSNVVKQLSFLDFCTKNVFPSTSTASTISIKQLFDDYHDIGISLNEFQTEEFTVLDGGQIDIEARLVICNTKELTVEDGGTVNLDKGEILIKPDAKLIVEGNVNINQYTKVIVEDGGEIIIRNGGTLANSGYIRLKDGAKMIYEEGAIFQMKDDNAELHFDGGDLFLEANALFTFEKGTSQSGQLRFSEWGEHIYTQGNNRILLEGNGDDDPIVVIDEDADFWANTEGGLDWISILSGEVKLDENARLVSIPEFTANNVHFSGATTNRGLITFDQTNISNTVFDEVPINAALHYKNAGTFDMTLSEVNHTIDGNMLRIKGMGYNISESEFNGDATYMVSAQNITEYSRITNTDFNGTLSTVGVIDNSNSTVEIKSCDFNTLYAGVHKLDGKAILRCNEFLNFKLAGAIAHNNCILDLSSYAQGGYNRFQKNSPDFGKNIALWNAQGFLLNKGFNYFDEQGTLPIIEGTMQFAPPSGTMSLLLARTNRWNVANSAPISGDIVVTSSIIDGLVINFATNTPNDGACPVSDILVGGTGLVVPSHQDGEATLNTLNFNQVSLSAALNTCIEATNTYDDSKTDVAALGLFEEVLTNYPSYDTSRRNEVLARYGASLMKQTLQHAFSNGEITIADNQGQFHAGVQSYVNVLNALSSVAYNNYNYEQLFYLEMDKAHLFRMIGKTDMALFILLNAESCGLDFEEQTHLNHYKFEWDQEIRMTDYGYKAEFKDTVWVDTTYYNIPTQQQYGEFGSLIVDASTINYFTCGQFRAQMKDDSEHNIRPLTVYPNPNLGQFSMEYVLPENSTGFVVVHDAAGQEIYRFNCQTGQQIETVNVSNVEKGAYFYSYYIDGVLENSGQVIVK